MAEASAGAEILAWLSGNAPLLSAAASVGTFVGLLLAWIGLRRTARAVQSNTLMQIHRDSRDLADLMQRQPKLMEVLAGTAAETASPRAQEFMLMLMSHYAAIFYQWTNSTLDDALWPAFRGEMQRFARLPYVRQRIGEAQMFGDKFAAFMQRLSEEG